MLENNTNDHKHDHHDDDPVNNDPMAKKVSDPAAQPTPSDNQPQTAASKPSSSTTTKDVDVFAQLAASGHVHESSSSPSAVKTRDNRDKNSRTSHLDVVAVAKHKGAEISARKARLVADLIRGAKVNDAYRALNFSQKKAAKIINKLLNSAVNNAKQLNSHANNLVIATIFVNEGRTVMRSRPRARGRASPIRKRSCHIVIELAVASKAYHAQRNHQKSLKHLKQALVAKKIRRQRANLRRQSAST